MDEKVYFEENVFLEKILSEIDEKIKEEEKAIKLNSIEEFYGKTVKSDTPEIGRRNILRAEHEKKKKELEFFRNEPYFARVKVQSVNNKNADIDIYVTRTMRDTRSNTRILKWTDANVQDFYCSDNKYDSLITKPNGDQYRLKIKREIKIEQGEIKNIRDLVSRETAANGSLFDDYLNEVLQERKTTGALTDIIETIQREQYEIISSPLRQNFIVQGCAGSGKTLILLHRLAYLYENHEIDLSKVVVITPNDNFEKHIEPVKNSLGLSKVACIKIENLYVDLLKSYNQGDMGEIKNDKEVYPKLRDILYDVSLNLKIKENFKKHISKFLNNSIIIEFLKECGVDSLREWDYKILKKAMEKAESILENKGSAYNRAELFKEAFDFDRVYKNCVVTELKEVFESHGFSYPKEHYRAELYFRLLISKLYYQERIDKYNLVAIDESQDFSIVELELLRDVLAQDCVFNIFGDSEQIICDFKNIKDWQTLTTIFPGIKDYVLSNNYRNSAQINAFCNRTLKKSNHGTGLEGSDVKVVKYYADDINHFIDMSFSNLRKQKAEFDKARLAIICKNKEKAKIKSIADTKDVAVLTVEEAKGLEFDAVIVFASDMSDAEKYISYTRAIDNLCVLEMDE